jgi:hypothetical protein
VNDINTKAPHAHPVKPSDDYQSGKTLMIPDTGAYASLVQYELLTERQYCQQKRFKMA